MVTVHTAWRNLPVVGVALITLMALATQSRADIYDLTAAGSSADINGGKFMTADIAPTGTGNIHSFVRVHGKGAEEGYNTDAKKFAYDEVGGHTHSLLLSAVPTVQLTPGGPSFYEFGLDINENNKNPLMSLDKLMIFRESSPALLVGGTNEAVELADLGTPLWNLDVPGAVPPVDNWIKLNYNLNAGSGKGDMYAYIPTSALAGGTGDWLYLYSRFGDNLVSTAGFEEWFVRTPTTPTVPAPAAVVLGMLGMSVAGWRLRRFA